MVNISKNKKLNYLLNIDEFILNNIKNPSKNIIIIINYLNYSKSLHKVVNKRIQLINNYLIPLNIKPCFYHFYKQELFEKTISDMLLYLKFQKYYLNIILKNWNLFNPIINELISKYLY